MANDDSCDFMDLVMFVFHLSERHLIALWTMVCWALWNARNKGIFEAVQDHALQILKAARSLLEDFQS